MNDPRRLMKSSEVPDHLIEEIERLRDTLILTCTQHSPEIAFNALSLSQAFLFASCCDRDYNKAKILTETHTATLYKNIEEYCKKNETDEDRVCDCD